MATLKLPFEMPGPTAAEMPPIAGTFSGDLLICGAGRCLWEDLDALGDFAGDVMAINYAGAFIPTKPLHWVSLHPEFFQWLLPLRGLRNDVHPHEDGMLHIGQNIHTHSNKKCLGVSAVWPKLVVPIGGGGSGLAAVRIGLLLGYERIVLAGMPMDGSGYFFDPPRFAPNNHAVFFGPFREAAKTEFKGRVRSLSGNTRELLGAP